jgi:hypothetical protein
MPAKSDLGVLDRGFGPAIEFFRAKINLPTRTWRELRHGQHAQAFVVAGAMKAELLTDLRTAMQDAIARNEGYETFKRRFKDIVDKHGWVHRGSVGWRSRVIWQTNMRVAYSVGRYQQMIDPAVVKHMPWWMYDHTTVLRPREEHKALDNRVYRYDNPVWTWLYPPNGWGCNCRVRPLSDRQLRKLGKTGQDTPPSQDEVDIPPEWRYNPGEAAWGRPHADAALRRAAESQLTPLAGQPYQAWLRPDDLPIDKAVAAAWPDGTDVATAWRSRYGEQTLLRDPRGDELLASDRAMERMLASGTPSATLLPQLRETIEQPVEIWANWAVDGNGRVLLRKLYLKRIEGADGRVRTLVAEALGGVWTVLRTEDDVSALRQGLLLWSRP